VIHSGLVRYHESLQPLLHDIDTVHQHPDNYNQGDLDAIVESIEVNGMYRPIFAQTGTGVIVAGNHTWEACKHLGATQIPVVYLQVSDTEAVRLLVADNRTASLARPNIAQLTSLLQRLDAEVTLGGTGYTPDDLTALVELAQMEPAYDEYATWPTLAFTVHPTVKAAFTDLTSEAIDMADKFELLLRLAGWDGSKR